jgi:hypothetical protein
MAQLIYPEIYELLESLNSSRISIIETGCKYTRSIARWVQSHPESNFACVDLNFGLVLETHRELERDDTAKHCTFLTQEHEKWLNKTTWLDAAFLNPADLASGAGEFSLAASAGAQLVVISDYQTRGAWAIQHAKSLGWDYESSGNLNILRRAK